VVDVQANQVMVKHGDQTEAIPCHTVLWGAGVQASPLAGLLAKRSGAEVDRAGRLIGLPDLSLPGHPEVFAIGDMINYSHQTGKPLPGVAQVAMQQAQYVATLIERRLQGKPPLVFHYKDRGSMATIGRSSAIAQVGSLHLSGGVAWLAWLFIHVLYLINFENRILVMSQWAWSYFTRGRSARLITGMPDPPPLPHADQK
jgi:NADH dehydrogenase